MRMNCPNCYVRPIPEGKDFCQQCEENLAEAAWERQQEEGFRGGEADAYIAEMQAWIQRNLK